MFDPIVTIDLHGLYREDAISIIDKELDLATAGTYQIRLIHGYNRGTALKNMIYNEYRHHPKVVKIKPGDDYGTTILVLRDFY